MIRKIISLVFVGLLCLAFAAPVFANGFRGGHRGFHHGHHGFHHHGFHRFGPVFAGGLFLGALAAPFYYPYPYAYPVYSAPVYSAPVYYAPAPAYRPRAYVAPSVQREVCYAGGCYRLHGDGVTVAYQWVWLPNAPPGPPGPAVATGPMAPVGPPRWTKFNDILFDFDKSELRSNETGKVSEIVAYLKDNPGAVIGIDGYADPRGSDQYNQALSERRVNTIREALVNAGVPADRITTGAYGEMRLKCHVPTQECWQSDRRVEVLINAR